VRCGCVETGSNALIPGRAVMARTVCRLSSFRLGTYLVFTGSEPQRSHNQGRGASAADGRAGMESSVAARDAGYPCGILRKVVTME
jgi:hypothetical protein